MSLWKLVKEGVCDGCCCKRSPRFPVEGGCREFDAALSGSCRIGGCKLMAAPILARNLTADEAHLFAVTCDQWPVPYPVPSYERTYTDAERAAFGQEFDAACCHKWVGVDG